MEVVQCPTVPLLFVKKQEQENPHVRVCVPVLPVGRRAYLFDCQRALHPPARPKPLRRGEGPRGRPLVQQAWPLAGPRLKTGKKSHDLRRNWKPRDLVLCYSMGLQRDIVRPINRKEITRRSGACQGQMGRFFRGIRIRAARPGFARPFPRRPTLPCLPGALARPTEVRRLPAPGRHGARPWPCRSPFACPPLLPLSAVLCVLCDLCGPAVDVHMKLAVLRVSVSPW